MTNVSLEASGKDYPLCSNQSKRVIFSENILLSGSVEILPGVRVSGGRHWAIVKGAEGEKKERNSGLHSHMPEKKPSRASQEQFGQLVVCYTVKGNFADLTSP